MSRYFFSIRYRDRLLPDQEGVVLPVDADLKQCALHLGERLMADHATSDVNLTGCAVEVMDSSGRHVMTVFLPS